LVQRRGVAVVNGGGARRLDSGRYDFAATVARGLEDGRLDRVFTRLLSSRKVAHYLTVLTVSATRADGLLPQAQARACPFL